MLEQYFPILLFIAFGLGLNLKQVSQAVQTILGCYRAFGDLDATMRGLYVWRRRATLQQFRIDAGPARGEDHQQRERGERRQRVIEWCEIDERDAHPKESGV